MKGRARVAHEDQITSRLEKVCPVGGACRYINETPMRRIRIDGEVENRFKWVYNERGGYS